MSAAAAVLFAASLACTITTGMDASTDGPTSCVPGSTNACTCSSGRAGAQICNSDGMAYGACNCTSGTCSVNVPNACTSTDQCCSDNGLPTVCASLPGAGQICSRRCTTNADCTTGCCAALVDGSHACAVARWCEPVGACTIAVGLPCSADSQCCPDTANGFQAACAGGTTSAPSCSTLCVDNSGCASSCCRARADGLKTCRPTAECQ